VNDHVYKKVELIGSSKTSVTDAIEKALSRASKTMRNLEWFEVDQIRGTSRMARSRIIRW
jgi:flavin-binding protein dodecin